MPPNLPQKGSGVLFFLSREVGEFCRSSGRIGVGQLVETAVKHGLILGLPAEMELGMGLAVCIRISQHQKAYDLQIFRNPETLPQQGLLVHAHDQTADAQVLGLVHHLGQHNGAVHIADFPAGAAFPAFVFVIADHQGHTLAIEAGGAVLELFQIRALDHQDPLGLQISGSGSQPSGFQDQPEFLRLQGAGVKFSHGKTLTNQLGKRHGKTSCHSFFHSTLNLEELQEIAWGFSASFIDILGDYN